MASIRNKQSNSAFSDGKRNKQSKMCIPECTCIVCVFVCVFATQAEHLHSTALSYYTVIDRIYICEHYSLYTFASMFLPTDVFLICTSYQPLYYLLYSHASLTSIPCHYYLSILCCIHANPTLQTYHTLLFILCDSGTSFDTVFAIDNYEAQPP
jgi:hypothetical protein